MKIQDIVVSMYSSVSTTFGNLLNKGTYMLIGVKDNTISYVSNGITTLIASLPKASYGSGKGYISIPAGFGLAKNIIIQFGLASVITENSTVITLPIPFPNNTICAVTSYNGTQVGVSSHWQFQGAGNLTSLAIWANGGTGTHLIGWIAIGY